jgi:hypothetical protein
MVQALDRNDRKRAVGNRRVFQVLDWIPIGVFLVDGSGVPS